MKKERREEDPEKEREGKKDSDIISDEEPNPNESRL